MASDTSWMTNSTVPDNTTVIQPNSTLPVFPIPPNAGRSLQPDIAACSIITLLIATAFVFLRFYTRGRVNNVLSASDWCILPALLCAAGVAASSLEQMAHGAGKHWWESDPLTFSAAFTSFERAAWYGILFYNLSLSLTRISILLLYKRIFTYSWIKRAIQIVLVLVIAIGIWLVVSVCTACMPLQAFWDWSLFWTQPVYCQPPNLWWANAALHIASDLIIMALPMPVLSSLNLPRRQKYAIIGVFALGFFVCIVSIVRLVALINATAEKDVDGIYTSAYMIFWTTVEVNAAISCACIMTLKPLIQRVFPRLLSPSKGHREHNLQWITPAHTINDHTNPNTPRHSRHFSSASNPTSPISPAHITHIRRHSATSSSSTTSHGCVSGKQNRGSGSGSGSGHSLPHLFEYGGDGGGTHYHHYSDTMEKSRYYHGLIKSGDLEYDIDHDLDLEAQRTHSVSTIAPPAAHGGGGTASSSTTGNSTTSGPDDDDVAAAAPGGSGDDEMPLDPAAGPTTTMTVLRAPPRAHLRMSTAALGSAMGVVGGGKVGEGWEERQRGLEWKKAV